MVHNYNHKILQTLNQNKHCWAYIQVAFWQINKDKAEYNNSWEVGEQRKQELTNPPKEVLNPPTRDSPSATSIWESIG